MGKEIIETERLILRPWRLDDAEACFKYASNPLIGQGAGWPAHSSVENSREIIQNILMKPYNFAITLKDDAWAIGNDRAIGSIGLHGIGTALFGEIGADEAEIGYWIGQPFWGKGYIPEAAQALMDYSFNELNLSKLYCGYYATNTKSARVSEKLGFHYEFTQDLPDGVKRVVTGLSKGNRQ